MVIMDNKMHFKMTMAKGPRRMLDVYPNPRPLKECEWMSGEFVAAFERLCDEEVARAERDPEVARQALMEIGFLTKSGKVAKAYR
jgi:hypothetical protein